MTETITIRVLKPGDDVLVSVEAVGLLAGLPLNDVRALAAGQHNLLTESATRDLKRRTQEAFAAIGDEDIWQAMQYWAARDHNATVEFVVDPAVHAEQGRHS